MNKIYEYIYNSIVEACVRAIESGNYDFAYNRYKSSVLALNEQFNTKAKKQETVLVKKLSTLHSKTTLT